MMIIISAFITGRVIGNGEGMPRNISEEFQQFLNFIKGNYGDDTYFPEFAASDWEIEKKMGDLNFEFIIYKRILQRVTT